jgi:hypothetical protein
MTRFVCAAIVPLVIEAERLLERAMLHFWMASLRDQLARERGVVR